MTRTRPDRFPPLPLQAFPRIRIGRTPFFAILTFCAGFLLALSCPGYEPKAADSEFFEKNIRPLFVEHCHDCHSSTADRVRGGLRLDSREDWLRGGDLGPAIEPGDPQNSLLMSVLNHEDALLKMPPKGKLPEREIALLGRWIEMGAPGPMGDLHRPVKPAASVDLERGMEFWAFQRPQDPAIPEVVDADWPRNGLDSFILSALEAEGIEPARTAEKRDLIRRATFDLIGLPPTPEEIDAFLEDDSQDAFARIVDRLLESPHYGERWARHWLDVARYADSNGLDENVAHGNAWRYRDYVVASFNDDKPYDRFLLEQIAGDLLPPTGSQAETHDRLIATGFLTLGPKVLAEPDKTKLEMDIVDEQVDTVGRALLGLTIGCARCHDHKFDPISTADYYALAGIFKSTRTMESLKTIARWHENSLATEEDLKRQADHEQEVEAARQAIVAFLSQANQQLLADRGEAEGESGDLPEKPEEPYPEQTKAELKRLRDALADQEASAPELPMAMGVTEGDPENLPVHIRGSHLTLGEVVPRRIPMVFSEHPPPTFGNEQSGRLELARWLVERDHPLTSRVMVNRIWRWHFGRGLVATPDNFGALGEPPSHPELLDWLAVRFVEEGWSIKAMHRLIMLSNTYQLGLNNHPEAARIDPENRLRGRMEIRRLEAEAIRDALLAISGRLDRSFGGSMLPVKNREFFFDHTSKDHTTYESPRRSLYLPVVRNHLYEMFQLFDGTDASVTNGDRATTTVAPQALFMLNSDLVLQSAEDLAARLLNLEDLDDPDRVRRLYETAYGRLPTTAELSRAEAFLSTFDGDPPSEVESRLVAWQALCQTILASNEFLYVR
ncbi:PSD1 and planctomycete cytochrome C domain-containing protein [soil metagenome]